MKGMSKMKKKVITVSVVLGIITGFICYSNYQNKKYIENFIK